MRRKLIGVFANALRNIDEKAAEAYEMKSSLMLEYVDRRIDQLSNIDFLLGPNTLDLLHTNHANHLGFMTSTFRVKSTATFVDVVSWVYSSYIARGIRPEYFPEELTAWKEAVIEYIGNDAIADFYTLMLDSHESFLELARQESLRIDTQECAGEHLNRYLAAILKPSSSEALVCTREYIRTVPDVQFWWLNVIKPAMHIIGRMWAEGEITVGQEHLATSITQRVMSAFYPMILDLPRDKGQIIFTASPGELHEIGPRMMADFLEINGWDVLYTGADTPIESIVDLLRREGADTLCISTTLPVNLANTSQLIKTARTELAPKTIRILVGGQAYDHDPKLWKNLGADYYTNEVDDAVRFLDKAGS